MRQVLANLVDNAIKYTPHGGDITVVAEEGEGMVTIKVRDTGIGIEPEERHRVWDRLYRGDQSRSKRGLGLGLSVVKAIVEAHGGRVEVGLRTDQGTELIVSLPQT
jgi:signal transduction histidine kinase